MALLDESYKHRGDVERWFQRGDKESEELQGGRGHESALRGQTEGMAGAASMKTGTIASMESYPAISELEPGGIIHEEGNVASGL